MPKTSIQNPLITRPTQFSHSDLHQGPMLHPNPLIHEPTTDCKTFTTLTPATFIPVITDFSALKIKSEWRTTCNCCCELLSQVAEDEKKFSSNVCKRHNRLDRISNLPYSIKFDQICDDVKEHTSFSIVYVVNDLIHYCDLRRRKIFIFDLGGVVRTLSCSDVPLHGFQFGITLLCHRQTLKFLVKFPRWPPAIVSIPVRCTALDAEFGWPWSSKNALQAFAKHEDAVRVIWGYCIDKNMLLVT